MFFLNTKSTNTPKNTTILIGTIQGSNLADISPYSLDLISSGGSSSDDNNIHGPVLFVERA
jgi:hypothetical protein